MLADFRDDAIQKIYLVTIERTVNATSGGVLNPISNEPTKPFGMAGGEEGFDEVKTSAFIYGTVSFFDTASAFRQFYRTGIMEEGLVGIVTDYDDSFDSAGNNKFLTASYIQIGSDASRYEVRVSTKGNLSLSVKTICKKVT